MIGPGLLFTVNTGGDIKRRDFNSLGLNLDGGAEQTMLSGKGWKGPAAAVAAAP